MVEYVIENMEETEEVSDEHKSSIDLPSLPLDPSSLDLPALDSPPTVTPTMKKNIITFAEEYSVNLASKRFKVPANTIKKWLKAENVLVRPKFNSPGQGRKISYSKETDQAIAAHVRELIARGNAPPSSTSATTPRPRFRPRTRSSTPPRDGPSGSSCAMA